MLVFLFFPSYNAALLFTKFMSDCEQHKFISLANYSPNLTLHILTVQYFNTFCDTFVKALEYYSVITMNITLLEL